MRIITDKAGWREAIKSMEVFDFYHTYEYHALHNNGEPLLFVFDYRDERLCLPMLIRNIEGTSYFDLTSVYGYTGCLYNSKTPSLKLQNRFRDEMMEFAFEHDIISAFSRIHTLIPNASLFPDNMGKVIPLNRTVYISTSIPESEQEALYSNTIRRQLKTIRETGLSIRTAESVDDWILFVKIYTRLMKEKQANDEYYFTSSYFLGLKNATEFKSHLLLAEYEGKTIAGALFTECGDFMQYHLGGVIPEYQHLSPLKLLIDHGRKIATGIGIKYLHLGGGYGGKDNGLFQFKSRFSHQFSTFNVWEWIVDKDIYNHLSEGLPEGRFPQYRNMKE